MLDRISAFVVSRLSGLRKDEDGAALVEYAAIFLVVAIAGVAGLTALGTEIDLAFDAIAAWVKALAGKFPATIP